MTVTFEGYERRADKINKCLADNGIASLEEALQIWEQLIATLQRRQPVSNGFLAESHYHLAWLNRQLKRDENARKLLIQSARFAARRRADEELEGSYIKFKEIKGKINSALAEWQQ